MDHTPEHPTTPSSPDPELDELYEAFLPTLIAARRNYARKRVAALLIVPIVLIVGVSWAAENPGAGADVAQLATQAPEPTVGDDVPEDEAPATPEPEEEPDETEGREGIGDDDELTVEVQVLDLGLAGSAVVHVSAEGVKLADLVLQPGWEGEVVELAAANGIAIVLSNGDVKLLATITPELEVELRDVTPEPEEEEPEIQTRKEIEVGDVGRVVVERDGGTLFLAVTWRHDWYEAVVVTQQGPRVYAYFTNDGVKHHIEAWIEGPDIAHGIWVTEPEPEPEPTPKPTPEPEEDDEPEIQTRKEIEVGEVGRVVVERDGKTLWLGVLWHHQYYDAVVVSSTGAEVHAYFTNDGFEHHVRAWIKGPRIKHEIWVVEPEIESYDGSVTCGFGNVGVLVEGNIARVMSVQEVEGVEWVIVKEVGEVVRVRFLTEEAVWILEAWGNGEAVVSECGQVE